MLVQSGGRISEEEGTSEKGDRKEICYSLYWDQYMIEKQGLLEKN